MTSFKIEFITVALHGYQASVIEVMVSADTQPTEDATNFEQSKYRKFIAERTPSLGYATAEQRAANLAAAEAYAQSLQREFGGAIDRQEW